MVDDTLMARETARLGRPLLHSLGVMAIVLLTGSVVRAAETAARPKITGVAFVRIDVLDMQRATRFYHETLQLPNLTCCCFGLNSKCFFINPSQQVDLIQKEAVPKQNRIDAIGIYTSDAGALRRYLLTQGQKPEQAITDANGQISFQILDPESHTIEFVQQHTGVGASIDGPSPPASRMIHAGLVVKDRAAMDEFYKGILGFRLYWSGGMNEGQTNWVAMQVPDGTDWIEYMLLVNPNADQRELGVMNHLSLGVVSVKAAAEQLERTGVKLPEQPKIGRDGKWQLNLYDPDWTRVELMEFTPVEKPCCAEYTGAHPKP
jgi:catechol 2,3-dioxygenase-like lactoylglutathione lyase family enzyme/predicted enzyme related to lactoylglutathione lyase